MLTNRQKQAIRTKNKIFDVSVELISKHGISNINIEDICAAADVSVGTFYNYYKSKNEVFYELYSRADKYFEEVVDKKLQDIGAPESILEFFDYYSIYCEKTGINILTQMMNASNKNFNKQGRYMQNLFKAILEKGMKTKKIESEKSIEELCNTYFIIARGVLFDWCLHDGDYDLRKKMKECILAVTL